MRSPQLSSYGSSLTRAKVSRAIARREDGIMYSAPRTPPAQDEATR